MATIDDPTFTAIFNQHAAALRRYALVFCRDEEASREIVQEVFLKLWDRRDSLYIEGKVEVYLYRMVRNKCFNFQRDKKVRTFVDDAALASFPDIDEPHADLPSMDDLKSAVAQLPDQCRTIFLLKRVERLSYKEISARLCISEKTVENQMGIALKKLRALVKGLKRPLGEMKV